MRANITKAKRHLQRLRELMSKRKSPFVHMSSDEVVEKVRKTREEIWEEKLATHS